MCLLARDITVVSIRTNHRYPVPSCRGYVNDANAERHLGFSRIRWRILGVGVFRLLLVNGGAKP